TPGGRIPAGARVEDQPDLLGCERRRGRRSRPRHPHDTALMSSRAREVLEHRLVGVPAGEHTLIEARGGLDAVEVVVAVERADRLQAQRHRALAKARWPALDRSKPRFIARAQPAEETAEVLDRQPIPGELVDGQEL